MGRIESAKRLVRKTCNVGLTLWRRADDRDGFALCERVRSDRLTYLEQSALLDLRYAVKGADRGGRQGVLVEAGCALGGSAIVMAASKHRERPFFVYDAFGMIPEPTAEDEDDVMERYAIIRSGSAVGIEGDQYYGYEPDLKSKVELSLRSFGLDLATNKIHLVDGLFEDTIPQLDDRVAVAHIDGDWYSSVEICLRHIWPLLVPGGVIVVDDYYHWSGCRKAVDEFLRGRADVKQLRRSRLQLVKMA